MRKIYYLLFILVLLLTSVKTVYSQGAICDEADPFCTGTTYDFPLTTDVWTAETGPSYGCLGSVPNPVWYYLKIATSGDINIHIHSTCGDVDYAAWGPFPAITCDPNDLFTNASNPNGTADNDNVSASVYNFTVPHENMIDCGYSTLADEDLYIPNAIVGEWYMVVITNFENCTGNLIFSQTGGTGATDCSIVEPNLVVEVNSETVCEGECADISATITTDGTPPYSYAWSDASLTGAGPHNLCPTSTTTYTVTVTDDAGITAIASGTITVNPSPQPEITGSGMCNGANSTLDAGAGYSSYIWSTSETSQEITISDTGTYSVTVEDNNGCQGIDNIVINSFSNPTPEITGFDFCVGLPATIDAGSGYASYIWSTTETNQTILVSVGGTYSVTVTDANGCEGSDDIEIVEYPLPTPIISGDDFCVGTSTNLSTDTGYDEYEWNTSAITQQITISIGGTYSVTVTDANGCEGSASKTISTIPAPTPTITGSNFCEGANSILDAGNYSAYLWSTSETTQNITVSSSGTYSVTVTNDNGCIGNTSINIVENANPIPNINGDLNICEGENTILNAGNYTTYLWSTSETSQTIIVNNSGTFIVTVTDANGCSGTNSVDVIQNAAPTPTISGELAICGGQASTLDAGTGYSSYIWSTNQTSQTISVTTTGTYAVTVYDAIGCSASTFVDVDVDVVNITTTSNQMICEGADINISASVLSGQSPYTYYWSNSVNTGTQTVSPTQETNYSVYVIDALGCVSSTESITITVSGPVHLSIYANTDTVCPGDPVLINSSISGGIQPYVLTNVSGNIITTNETVYPNNTTSYNYTVEDACGSTSNDDVTINTYPIPPLSIQADILQGCEPLIVHFVETSSNDNYSYVWTFISNDENNLSLSHNTFHLFDTWGIYDVGISVTTDKGCKNSLFIDDMINVYRKPDAKFLANPDLVSIINPTIQLDNYSNWASNYIWSFDNGDSSDIENPVYTFNNIGYYNVQLVAISENGCVDTVYHMVKVEDIFTLYVPTAFSPNGDGINDSFYVTGNGSDLDAFNLRVYDRWGEIIWETDDFFEKWDGRVKGKTELAQIGTYKWMVVCRDFKGVEYTKTGNVTIIR